MSLKKLRSRLGNVEASESYSYVVTTVKIVKTIGSDQVSKVFKQIGSAPNFQEGVLTLCTCKHQMRTSRKSPENWNNVWIAGFTSRSPFKGKHWLFYLAQIEQGYDSHSDLWTSLNEETRESKAAHKNPLGDVFNPRKPIPAGDTRFLPDRYFVPDVGTHVHRQNAGAQSWKNDISYDRAERFGDPAMLVAKPQMTFLWDKPLIHFAERHCRNYRRWPSIKTLLDSLH